MPYPPDPQKYDMIGTVRVRHFGNEKDLKAELQRRVCGWGGDGYLRMFASRIVSSITSYIILRELRPGESSETWKRLGIGDDKLKEKVAFDTNCAADQIKVIKKREDQGSGDYVVEACGKTLKYSRGGTVYGAVGTLPSFGGSPAAQPFAATASGTLPKLAVMPIDSKSLPKRITALLDEMLANAMHATGRFNVIAASDVGAMLGYEQLKDSVGCDDATCFAEIGGSLGADYLLAGTAGILGDEMVLSLKVIDTKQQTVAARNQVTCPKQKRHYAAAVRSAAFGVAGVAEPRPVP